jgi:cobalamin biosynthesis protein CobD/CbiB
LGYYDTLWQRMAYVHLFEGIPMLEMACVTIALLITFGGLALFGASRDPIIEAGACYAAGLILVGLLVSFATCFSTYFQARLYLPLYSLFQMGMLLSVSLAANVLLEKLASLKTHAERRDMSRFR